MWFLSGLFAIYFFFNCILFPSWIFNILYKWQIKNELINWCLPCGRIETLKAGDWAYTLVGGGCSHHCTNLVPYCPFVGQPNKCRTTVFFYFNYFVSLVRLFPIVYFTSQWKSVLNQKAMETCFFKEYLIVPECSLPANWIPRSWRAPASPWGLRL